MNLYVAVFGPSRLSRRVKCSCICSQHSCSFAGIIPEEVVEPLPCVLVALVKRLVRWGILPKSKAPDTAIVNIYDVDDCIPPHIDHLDFDRPFVTLSLLSEQPIMFGSRLIPLAPGEFGGSNCFIPLPVGKPILQGRGQHGPAVNIVQGQ
jgi:alkylated DNA repair protein alkB family protein 5